MMMDSTRRLAVTLLGLAPLMLAKTARAQTPSCFDPNALPLSQKSRRRSLGYLDPSSDPERRCAGCSFFKASDAQCGACGMLSGGPVSASAVCSAFAARSPG
jgi:hypothetical protein